MAVRICNHQLVDPIVLFTDIHGDVGDASIECAFDPGHLIKNAIADLMRHLPQLISARGVAQSHLHPLPINIQQLKTHLEPVGTFFCDATDHQRFRLDETPVLIAHFGDLTGPTQKIRRGQQFESSRAMQIGSDDAAQICRRITCALPTKRHRSNRNPRLFALGDLDCQRGCRGIRLDPCHGNGNDQHGRMLKAFD